MLNQQLIVKLKADSLNFRQDPTDRLNHLVGKHVFDKVEPLFPDESDKTLALIYIAKIAGDPELADIVDSLNKRNEIDYAHIPSERQGY